MTVDDHRLIARLAGAHIGIDYALTVTVQDMMIIPELEPELPLDLLRQVGQHLLRVGDALVRRADSPAWPT
jgi:hypothetical protein